jgi:hypothetical protein
MKVCTYRGLLIAVLTRNEHCPPHVHVGTGGWNARFEFSFWHNGVRLWDVMPIQESPSAGLLEEIRQAIRRAENLHCARKLWWQSRQTLCLDNLLWDTAAQAVVTPKGACASTVQIVSGRFDGVRNMTVLHLADDRLPLEIQL